MGSGQRSSASGSSVWLVYEHVWRVMLQARSHSMVISSTSRRMSSATAIDGCVSFIWIANFSWKRSGGIFWTLQMRSMSCSEQRHEEVLLLEPQFLAARLLVVRIENLGEVLAGHLLVDRAVVVAAIERAEVERLGRLGLPQPQCVRRVHVVAEDRRVVRNAVDDVARHPARALAAVTRRTRLRCDRRTSRRSTTRAARSPTGCRSAATCRSSPPASRRRSPAGRCRTRSGCRSRAPALRAWPANR